MLATAVINILMMVPYVPSRNKVVKQLIKIANLKNGEKIYDLGCGDGRILIEAEKAAHANNAKIKTVGYEAAPIPFLLALIRKHWNRSGTKIRMKNFFRQNLGDADVIFCYLGPDTAGKLANKIKDECRAGTRIYSHTFSFDGLPLKKSWPKNRAAGLPSIYYYQV